MTKEHGEKRKLSNRAYIIWGIKGIGLMTIVFGFLLFSPLKQNLTFISEEQFSLYLGSMAIACFSVYLIYLKLKHNNHFYIIADNELVICSGILNTEQTIIPYIKIESVNISIDIIQRILGVGTLKIETAGGVPGEAEGIIPYLADYKKIASEILKKIETAKGEITV
ncbi:MAG: PH domain-containing protein [Candidatus Micrarchaeota archaeon]